MKTISNKKAVSWIIATIITPLAVSMTFSNIYIAFWYMKTAHQGRPPVAVIQRAIFSTAFLGLWLTVGLWWLIKRKTDSFTDLFATRTDSPLKDIFIGLGLGIFWVIIYGVIGWPTFSDMFVLDLAKLKSVPASLSAGFCEEFLFRGFVILLIARTGASRKWQIIWSSLAFGMAHIFWGPVGMLFTVGFGATFAVATLRRGNVWPAVIAHSVLNLCVEPALLQKAMTFGSQY
ncbi:MAG: CPBP family intramembrane glutamic endopeptidase [Planctomycetota bacterium]|jgi:membrane protease YdiL (CAAX protease family)